MATNYEYKYEWSIAHVGASFLWHSLSEFKNPQLDNLERHNSSWNGSTVFMIAPQVLSDQSLKSFAAVPFKRKNTKMQ